VNDFRLNTSSSSHIALLLSLDYPVSFSVLNFESAANTCLYEPKNLESRPLEFSFHVELINIEESERINSSERQSKAAMEDM